MKLFYFVSNLAEISKKIPLPKSHLWFRILAWRRTGVKPLYETKMSLWPIHMSAIWPQWINELGALLKTEYRRRGSMHVVVNWEQSIHTSWTWLTLTNVTTLIFHIPYRILLNKWCFTADANPSILWVSIRIKIWFGIEFIVFGKKFRRHFSEIDTHCVCPNIVSLVGVVVMRWALCV